MRKAKLQDGYVETKAIAEGDVFADLFSLTGYGISFARDVAYSHSAATRRDPNDYTLIGLAGIRQSCGARCAMAVRENANHKMSIEVIFPNCYN